MKRILFIALCLATAGCQNPFNRTRDASGAGPTGTISATTDFVVFRDELTTGGGAFEFPGSDAQSLSFNDTSNPLSRRSIRYSWTGDAVAGQSVFAGFDLMHTTTLAAYAGTPGRNLVATGSNPNYTKVTFYARGSLSSNTVLKIEVADDGNTTTPDPCLTLSKAGAQADDVCSANGPDPFAQPPQVLSTNWMPYTLAIPNASLLSNIKDFFKATFVFTPSFGAPQGQGGTVYIDKIQYEQ